MKKQKKMFQHNLIDQSIWDDFKFHDNDIIIDSYQKSGTTWVQQITAQLIWNGKTNINLSEVSPWIDCNFPSKEERINIIKNQTHRRFFKSHLPFELVKYSDKVKYIYIARDGRDVVWSLYNHHIKFKKEAIININKVNKPKSPILKKAPETPVKYFREWLEHDGYPWWPFWDHILSWWNNRNLTNIMLIHYNELKTDLPYNIKKIASFLNIMVEDSRLNKIIKHCTFKYMKKNSKKYAPFSGELWNGGAKVFFKRGTNKRWKNMLTDEDIYNYEKTAYSKLGSDCAKWLITGNTC
jgi:aryl sulfotransferase